MIQNGDLNGVESNPYPEMWDVSGTRLWIMYALHTQPQHCKHSSWTKCVSEMDIDCCFDSNQRTPYQRLSRLNGFGGGIGTDSSRPFESWVSISLDHGASSRARWWNCSNLNARPSLPPLVGYRFINKWNVTKHSDKHVGCEVESSFVHRQSLSYQT